METKRPATESNPVRKSSQARACGTRCFMASQFARAALSEGLFCRMSRSTCSMVNTPFVLASALPGSAAAMLHIATKAPAQTVKFLFKIFIHLPKLGVHYDTPIPLRVGSGHTTGVRKGNSDQKGAVPLENRDRSSLDRRGGERKIVKRETWQRREPEGYRGHGVPLGSGGRTRSGGRDGRGIVCGPRATRGRCALAWVTVATFADGS